MPINATAEYYSAEARFRSAKTNEEKILTLEEMIRLLPKHKGTENILAQLRSKLSKQKKESIKKKGRRFGTAIKKSGEAQVCLVGLTNSGKSCLLNNLTGANVEVGSHPYTTTKPAVGMMDYKGLKVQMIEIPSLLEPRHLDVCRTCNLIVFVVRNSSEIKILESVLADNFIRKKFIVADTFNENPGQIKEKIWGVLKLMIVYTEKGLPMALPDGSTIRDFAERIHKDFIRNFRFARLIRNKRIMSAGLSYKLKENDIVEIHLKK